MRRQIKVLALVCAVIFLLLPASTWASNSSDEGVCGSRYKFKTNCLKCHSAPYGHVLPDGIRVIKRTFYILIQSMDFEALRLSLMSLKPYGYDRIVVDLYSYGGALFQAMGMVSLLEGEQKAGKVIEIRARGIVASAGLLIMLAGSPGQRFIDKNAIVMFHELQAIKWPTVETPTDKEEEAKIYRFIQNQINTYIASRSKISVEELAEKIKKKEFWLSAQDAVKYGFADSII